MKMVVLSKRFLRMVLYLFRFTLIHIYRGFNIRTFLGGGREGASGLPNWVDGVARGNHKKTLIIAETVMKGTTKDKNYIFCSKRSRSAFFMQNCSSKN